jgi:hypothetical protein
LHGKARFRFGRLPVAVKTGQIIACIHHQAHSGGRPGRSEAELALSATRQTRVELRERGIAAWPRQQMDRTTE